VVSTVLPAKPGLRLGERTLDALAVVHRWVGTALCLVFALWFASGIVLMYAGYPVIGEGAKLARTPPLDTAAVRLTAAEAYAQAGLEAYVEHVRLGMLLGRPMYFFVTDQGWFAVGADDGALQPAVDTAAARRLAREYLATNAEPVYGGFHALPDQWTIYASWAPYLPSHDFRSFHRLVFDDGTEVSVLSASGDVTQVTTRSDRVWGYLGAFIHWIYPTTLRTQHAEAWDRIIVWLSSFGTLVCISGIVIGVWQFRWRREPGVAGSPYRGWLKWHHWVGLIFGAVAGTWVFSGLMSMDPFAWSTSSASPNGTHAEIMAGGALDLAAFSGSPAAAGAACRAQLEVKEIRLVQLHGAPYYYCVETPQRTALVAAVAGASGSTVVRFPEAALLEAAREIMPGVPIAESELLDGYDAYYYPGWEDKLVNGGAKRLPVLRVVFDDAERTLLYIDPHSGAPVGAYDANGRRLRWLYHGLHSLDFGSLYGSRPLWDLVVLVFMLGGFAMSVTGTWLGWKWLKRKVRKPLPQQKRREASAAS
jgi:hypothetical protein